MRLLSWLFRAKATVGRVVQLGTPRHMPRTTRAYAREGYQECVTVYRCVDIISKALAGIDLQVMVGDEIADDNHPLVRLLQRPNPIQAGSAFLQTTAAFRLITGQAFMEKLGPDNGPPMELWNWTPYEMKVIVPDGARMPAGFLWDNGKSAKMWECDGVSGDCEILQWKTFNPLDPFVGLSPIGAAAISVDQHNEAGKWNLAMLQNSAQPSGIMTTEPGQFLTDPQFEQLQARLRKQSGAGKNSHGMILEGGLNWQQTALSQKDMDWLEGKNTSAQDVAGAYGVPLQVIPLPGAQTFANYEQARMALYEDTVLPLLDDLLDEWNMWLSPAYGDNIRIRYDKDTIPALESRRQEKWEAIEKANWLSINEKREATGYEPINPDDEEDPHNKIYIPSGIVPIDIDDQDDGEEESVEDAVNRILADTGENPVPETPTNPKEEVEA